ncbi:hypothetical protein [Humibacter ginsenosidimutans]|uniref:Bacterial Pleckstrin homology domain-containing protein n=1 Tax=Humibacter ginsenosidimutans TaxID=2599293 RepID=A0A5B8M558_9MICO|nr:hypothetical protein [Humibacter ginsenosidimutans]QDZ15503.1 hypothetical protein FPZ11_12685 [Humibacter ginsenosidimutans]
MSAIKPSTDDDGRGEQESGWRHRFAGKSGLLRIVVPVVAVCIGIVALIGSQQTPAYTISDTSLTIAAASGETIPFTDITNVALKNAMPPNLVKVVGDRVGTQLRGDFDSNGTAMTIYVNTAVPPFVYLDTKNGPVIFNDQSAAKTRSLYDEIRHKVAAASN